MTAPPASDPLWSFGITQEFPGGEHAWAEAALASIVATGAAGLRLPVSQAGSASESALQWLDWLIPELAGRMELLPSLRADGEGDYTAFVADFLDRYGQHFGCVELCAPVRELAPACCRQNWRFVLNCPMDAQQILQLGESGLLQSAFAIGLRARSGDRDWTDALAGIRDAVARYKATVEIWITETEGLDCAVDRPRLIRDFLSFADNAPGRFYWAAGPKGDPAGILAPNGRPKLLARLLAEGGIAKLRAVADLARPTVARQLEPILVVGGAGFIGSNLADSLLSEGKQVLVLDSLARPGVELNLEWLRERHPHRLSVALGDIRDASALEAAIKDASAVYHFAAQVAVTTSLVDPLDDFSVNAEGTLRLLEAVRRKGKRTPLIFSSTNKVYGGLEHLEMMTLGDCYFPVDGELRAHGIGETAGLDFCTPYGCSKGVADQYVLDYAKSFGLPTAVLRMSCIYGPRQFGTEDQGWVAHFLLRAMTGEPITIYGDGMQVRDILHVRDAVAAYRGLLDAIDSVKGQAFNLGGGPANAVSLRMVLQEIGQIIGRDVAVSHAPWRTGDQFYFVSDTRKLEQQLGWRAHMGWREGLRDLAGWIGSRTGGLDMKVGEPERLRA